MNEAPKYKQSLLLLSMALFALIPVRIVLELIAPRRRVPPPSRPSEPDRRMAAPFLDDDINKAPRRPSVSSRDDRIRERAFQIWLDEGKPQGRDHEHWMRAAAELRD